MAKALFVTTVEATHRAFLMPFARHFREQGWKVDGAAAGISRAPECLTGYDQVFEMRWSRNPLMLRAWSSSARAIRSIVADGSYDIVHVHTPIAAFVTRFALRKLRRTGRQKVAYTAHGFHFHPEGNPVWNAVFFKLEKAAGRWTDRLIVINEADFNVTVERGIMPRERVVIMPGIGIDREAYSPDSVKQDEVKAIRAELGLGETTPLFLMLAEFMPGKRHIDVIEAFRGLNGDTHLAFAGRGRSFAKVQRMVNKFGLNGRIHFLGLRRDVPALIRSSVATVIPSIREGLSRCVMESLCLEVPVIGTEIRGVADLLKYGGGLMVPIRSPKSLRSAMQWVLDHPEEAKAMGRKGRETTQKYDIRNLIRLHEDLYKDILAS